MAYLQVDIRNMGEKTAGNGDRPRGALTPEDRAYLAGETDYEYSQSEINARRRIRERIYHTLLDGHYLFTALDSRDCWQIFDPRHQPRLVEDEDDESVSRGMAYADEYTEEEWSRLQKALEGWLALIYSGVEEPPLLGQEVFASLVEGGIRQVIENQNCLLDEFDLIIETQRDVSDDELLDMFEAGESLTNDELVYLFRHDLIGGDDLLNSIEGRSETVRTNYTDDDFSE